MGEPQDSRGQGSGQDDIQGGHHQGIGTSQPPQLSSSAFHTQYSNLPQLHPPQSNIPRGSVQLGPYSASSAHDQGASAFNMVSMAGNLPHYPPSANRMPGASPSAITYDLQHMTQYPGQSQSPYSGDPMLSGQYPNTFSQVQMPGSSPYGSYVQNQARPYPNYPQQAPQYSCYYAGQYGAQPLSTQQFPLQYGRSPSLPQGQMQYPQAGADTTMLAGYANRFPGGSAYPPESQSQTNLAQYQSVPSVARNSPESNISSTPRGPPRKPKQSGHALWVGNLPPGTNVTDLKDHFSREATTDIESLFLISKSNCAFVNYRTEASCTAAMHRFHDSRFHGVRLVCRLRRSATPTSGVPTGPSAMADGRTTETSPDPPPGPSDSPAEVEPEEKNPVSGMVDGETTSNKMPEKFFVVKSLTMQDLEQSVQNGIWATQSHNEQALNRAYETADNVYLIFSANKSGEYFGYARMASPISQDASQLLSSLPKPSINAGVDAPRSIPTPATEHAPKGRIIDDSARGTIFWEAELSESEEEEEDSAEDENQLREVDSGETSSDQEWGKPFRVEWISTNRLPFFKTRGLRNPWNANREVKIARDGTELETGVGRRLIQMFPRGLSPNTMGVSRPY